MRAKVMVLCPGFIRKQGKVIVEAHSSCTLVVSEAEMMVVDTSSSAYRLKIVASLQDLGIKPEEISVIVNTHHHLDHCANNDLFTKAKTIAFEGEPERGEEEYLMSPSVRLVRTPGHTPGSVSVFVEAERRYAIVGDAIPTVNNYLKWVPPGLNYDSEKALRSMRRIIDWAEVVVPGHGPPFEVKA